MSSATTMGVKLEPQIRTRLKVLAESRERSTHWMMKKAILEYLEREEAREQEKQEDMERWARYEATGKTIPHKKVTAWLDSVGTDKEKACPQ